MSNREGFYTDAEGYWENVDATVDGMLGGYSKISPADINGSQKFLKNFITKGSKTNTQNNRALDCGAGIGRITKRLLVPLFNTVDMVEVCGKFLEQAKTFLGENAKKVDQYYCSGLQDFSPEQGRYDVIWCQWVLGHLTDKDLVEFFTRCKKGLAPNGILCVKENISAKIDFDEQDSSYTRTRDMLVKCMTDAGLNIIKEEKQKDFPKEIYEVRMFALQ